MDLKGDGIRRWHYGKGDDPETFYLVKDAKSKEGAIKGALDEMLPGDTVTVCTAERALMQSFEVGDWFVDSILERLVELDDNLILWGEEGPEYTVPPEADDELAKEINRVLEAWYHKHRGCFQIWQMTDIRDREVVVLEEDAA